MICDSTAEQKRMFNNVASVARNLSLSERDLILHIVEAAHVPPDFRCLIRDKMGVLVAAKQSHDFLGAIFEIVREAVLFGVPIPEPIDPLHPMQFSQIESDSYLVHKPRALSVELAEKLAEKIPDRFFKLAVSSLLDSLHIYLRLAEKSWPETWKQVEFSDFAEA